jgi:hypothetical protein
MKYSELSIDEFLNEIINPNNKNGLPKIELYNYAKNKTTNFEIKPLKLMIEDVVDFANHKMRFEANKTALSIPTNDEIEVRCMFSIEGYLQFWAERYSTKILHDSFNYTDEEKKEKIQFLRDSCKDIVYSHSVYKKLIFLVHIAETTHKVIPSLRMEWICFPINFWSVGDFSDILIDELAKYDTDKKKLNDTINQCESKEDIPNIIKIYDTAIELTDSIHKAFTPYRYGRGNAGNQIVLLDEVYILKRFYDVVFDIIERNINNQFANDIKIDSLLEPYKNEFRRGYDETITNCVPTSISFKDDVFSAATHLHTPFYYDPENNILPDTWGIIGYNFGRFYAAWCIVLKKQRFFEPLFSSMLSDISEENSAEVFFSERHTENSLTNSDIKNTYTYIIEKIKNIDSSKGWSYAFKTEEDINLFAKILSSYFHGISYVLPSNKIALQKRSKTRLAKILREIHYKKSPKENLTTDTDFFEIIRILNLFEKEKDICHTLTR